MTGFELRALDAAARAIFPRGAHPDLTIGAEDLDVRGYFSALVARSPLRIAAALRLTILICAFGPLFVLGRWKTLASLERADREETIRRLVSSPNYGVRQLVLLLKVHVAMIFGANAEARAVMLPAPEAQLKSDAALISNLTKGGAHGRSVA